MLTRIAAYGVYAFFRRDVGSCLFLRSQFVFFDFDEPRILFFLEFLAVPILFAWFGYGVKKLLKYIRR